MKSTLLSAALILLASTAGAQTFNYNDISPGVSSCSLGGGRDAMVFYNCPPNQPNTPSIQKSTLCHGDGSESLVCGHRDGASITFSCVGGRWVDDATHDRYNCSGCNDPNAHC